jgi:hypothetical protein
MRKARGSVEAWRLSGSCDSAQGVDDAVRTSWLAHFKTAEHASGDHHCVAR